MGSASRLRFVGGKLLAMMVLAMVLAMVAPPGMAQSVIRLSTTTSTETSGLLRHLLPVFEAKTGSKVHVIAVGSGKALELAKNGDVDVTLVHAREAEDRFVAAGHGVQRRNVMFNDFILVGPAADPAGIAGMRDVIAAMKKIAAGGTRSLQVGAKVSVRFISRGDNSGTDQMEQSYWRAVGARPSGPAYVSAGLGMGEVLSMAAEMRAYTLTDRATHASHRAKSALPVLVEGDRRMFNPYGIIAVNPKKYPGINHAGALQLIDWMTSPEGQNRIAAFRVGGQQLFFPSPQN